MSAAQTGVKAGQTLRLELTTGTAVRARAVVIASGVRYRRPNIPNLSAFEGAGVSYWASPIEAKLCEGEEIALVGGGNSAGQAVVFLAPKVTRLHLIVRGAGLEASMSRYLIDRISALPNVELHVHSEVVGLQGDRALGLTRGRVPRLQKWRRAHLRPPSPVSCSSAPILTRLGFETALDWMPKASW